MSHEIRTPDERRPWLAGSAQAHVARFEPAQLVRTASSSGSVADGYPERRARSLEDRSWEAESRRMLRCRCIRSSRSVVALFRANAEHKDSALRSMSMSDVVDWVDRRRSTSEAGPSESDRQRDQIHRARWRDLALDVGAGIRGLGWCCLRGARYGHRYSRRNLCQTCSSHFIKSSTRRSTPSRRHWPGLAISQRIVEAMGSKIDVRKRAGRRIAVHGSRSRWKRYMTPNPSDAARLGDGRARERSDLRRIVLIVEDNDVNRMIAREMLLSRLGLRGRSRRPMA